jgi:uncharacterized protein YPO0396
MAADYIVVTKTNRPQLGNQLVTLANKLRDVRDLCDALNDAGQHQFEAADYSLFQSQFGVSNGANVLTLIGEVTGANRLSQLDEFVSRLAGQ